MLHRIKGPATALIKNVTWVLSPGTTVEMGQHREFAALPRAAARPTGTASRASAGGTFRLPLDCVSFVARDNRPPWATKRHPLLQQLADRLIEVPAAEEQVTDL